MKNLEKLKCSCCDIMFKKQDAKKIPTPSGHWAKGFSSHITVCPKCHKSSVLGKLIV